MNTQIFMKMLFFYISYNFTFTMRIIMVKTAGWFETSGSERTELVFIAFLLLHMNDFNSLQRQM